MAAGLARRRRTSLLACGIGIVSSTPTATATLGEGVDREPTDIAAPTRPVAPTIGATSRAVSDGRRAAGDEGSSGGGLAALGGGAGNAAGGGAAAAGGGSAGAGLSAVAA
eukprot:6412841-Prymnesium_polylepis.1